MLENEVFNRPHVRDITKTCECTCSVTCNPDIITNADRIRAMSDEELAEFIPNWSYTNACKCEEQSYADCNLKCEECVLDWLQQPAEED